MATCDRATFRSCTSSVTACSTKKRGEGCLIFVNEQGSEYPLGERSVREIFCGRKPEPGVSQRVRDRPRRARGFQQGRGAVAGGARPAGAGRQPVQRAGFFGDVLRAALLLVARARHVAGQAAREARIAVNYSLHGEPIDWAVPVLYARDPNLALCPSPGSAPSRAGTTRARQQRGAPTRVTRDAHRGVGHGQRVSRLSSARLSDDERRADRSSASSWRIFRCLSMLGTSTKTSEATYLSAERLVSEWRSAPVELGVDVLACVTRHWMCRDETYEYLRVTADDGEAPIMIFSVAGFDQLPGRARHGSRHRECSGRRARRVFRRCAALTARQQGTARCTYNQNSQLPAPGGAASSMPTAASNCARRAGHGICAHSKRLLNLFT